MRDYHDNTSEDEQLPDDEASLHTAPPVSIHSPTPVSKLEEAVHSMVERIKTSYAMDRQLATLLGQMSSQTTDPRDTWISWMGSEMRTVQPQHWRDFQMASLDFIRCWTPHPNQPHQ